MHQVLLNWLGDLDAIDWTRASLDSVRVRARRGGEHTGPDPTLQSAGRVAKPVLRRVVDDDGRQSLSLVEITEVVGAVSAGVSLASGILRGQAPRAGGRSGACAAEPG